RLHSIRGLPRCRVILGRTVSGSSTALSDSGAGAMTSERELCKQPVNSWTWKPGYATAASRVLWKLKRRILSVSQKRDWVLEGGRRGRNMTVGKGGECAG